MVVITNFTLLIGGIAYYARLRKHEEPCARSESKDLACACGVCVVRPQTRDAKIQEKGARGVQRRPKMRSPKHNDQDAHRIVGITFGRSCFFFEVEHADCAVRKIIDEEFDTIEDFMEVRTRRVTVEMIELRYPVDLVKRGEYMEALTMCPNPN